MKTTTSIDKMTFNSPVGLDDGYKNHNLGQHSYTMELFANPDGSYFIEWIIPKLDEVTHIGIWHENKELTDYDGVFELPEQAIQLLEKNGFNCEYAKR